MSSGRFSALGRVRERIGRVLERRSFAHSVAVLSSGSILGHAVGLIAAPIILRLFTPADFGILGVFTSILTFVVVASTLQLDLAIRLPREDRVAAALLVVTCAAVFVVSVVATLVAYRSAGSITAIFNAVAMEPFFWIIGLTALTSGFYQVFGYWAMRRGAYGIVAEAKVVLSVTRAAVSVGMGFIGIGAIGLVLAEVGGRVVAVWRLLVRTNASDRRLFTQVTTSDSADAARRYRRFPMYSQPAALLHSFQSVLPVLALSAIYGTTVAGLFTFVQRGVWAPVSLISQTIGEVYISRASELSRDDPAQMGRLFDRITVTLLKVLAPPILLLSLVAPPLFSWIFGGEWYTAGEYLRLLSLTFIVMLIVGPVFQTINILERQHWLLGIDLGGVILMSVGFLLADRLGWSAERAVLVYAVSMICIYTSLYFVARAALRSRLRAQP